MYNYCVGLKDMLLSDFKEFKFLQRALKSASVKRKQLSQVRKMIKIFQRNLLFEI